MRFAVALASLLLIEGARAFAVPSFISGKTSSRQPKPIFGILDEINSDAFSLGGNSNEGTPIARDDFEIFLGDLVFSTNDPRVDIMNNYEQATSDEFMSWMEKKAEKSNDPEERLALKDLLEMIVDVKRKVEISKMAEERKAREAEVAEAERIEEAEAEAEAGRQMSNTDVLRKAAAINSAGTKKDVEESKEKKSFYDQELTPEIRMSYEDTLKKLLPPYKPGDTAESLVQANYDKFDAQFVKVLNERATGGEEGSIKLLEALSVEQRNRIAAATESLKSVLALGDPMKMEGALVKMGREGKIDEPFLLLLEANETQARDAGATGPAQLMKRLRMRAAEEKDKQVTSKEIRLIRKLLRAENSQAREKLLEDAFTPKENLLVAGTPENAMKAFDGEQPEQEKPMPDVLPPDFINACKAVTINFGNLEYDDDRGDLASRIKQIAAEAEVVATRIYGQGMSLRDQQDRAWKEQTTSIFDLEKMELEAEARGEHAPWTNPDADDDMLLPGFDAQGKMKIGGD